MKAKSDRWYVQNKGIHCPYCESDQIEGQSINTEGGFAFQEVSCLSCNKSWTDSYKLVGYIKGK